jgi:hypothetical protein
MDNLPTDNAEAYGYYMEALGLRARWSAESFNLAMERIDKALQLEPDFVAAWLLKSNILTNAPSFLPARTDELLAEAGIALQRAIELAPENRLFSINQSNLNASTRGDWIAIEESYRQAIEDGIDENELWKNYRFLLGYLSEFNDPQRAIRYVQLNPLDPLISFWSMVHLDATGYTDMALAEYERGRQIFDVYAGGAGHAKGYSTHLGQGDLEGALNIALEFDSMNPVIQAVAQNLDSPDEILHSLNQLYEDFDETSPYRLLNISDWAAYFGDEQLALAAMADDVDRLPIDVMNVWAPLYRNVRQTPEFKDLMRDMGIVEFWRKYGWPDLCRPAGQDDFTCY